MIFKFSIFEKFDGSGNNTFMRKVSSGFSNDSEEGNSLRRQSANENYESPCNGHLKIIINFCHRLKKSMFSKSSHLETLSHKELRFIVRLTGKLKKLLLEKPFSH